MLLAVRLGHESIVDKLLHCGATVEAKRFDGKNAIQIASVPEIKGIHDLLIQRTCIAR